MRREGERGDVHTSTPTVAKEKLKHANNNNITSPI